MPDRVLVPLDGSRRAERILVQARRLLRREDTEAVLLHVLEPSLSLSKVAEERRSRAQAYLAAQAAALGTSGIRTRTLLEEGPVAETILRAANDARATLLALSTHGRGGLARWVLGSVAEKVLRGAPVPVFLMRSFRDAEEPPAETAFRKVLVPFDGSKTSVQVVPAAAALAALFKAEILVLSVEAPVPASIGLEAAAGTIDDAREDAAKGVARFRERGAKARALTARGDPAERILDAAEQEDVDLIAMATHGWSGLTRWMLGSVTEKVLRHSTRPMLVVRPARA